MILLVGKVVKKDNKGIYEWVFSEVLEKIEGRSSLSEK